MHKLILASESPRRRQLLQDAGFEFVVLASKVSETPNKNLNVNEQILDIARRKASATRTLVQASPEYKNQPVYILAADTEVIFEDAPLGKPSDSDDAIKTLKRLSGQRHQVITAVVLIDCISGQEYSSIETTEICFHPLQESAIFEYVATGDPLDKAGSYGIQGDAKKFVEKIEGSFDNVVGLPIDAVKLLFEKAELQNIKSEAKDVLVLAVSKLQPIEKIERLYKTGQRDFGENYVQEALTKQMNLMTLEGIKWHLIGHLQRKKVNQIIGKFHLIHSVDSLELAKEIGSKTKSRDLIQDLLLQVNIANEDSKEGFLPDQLIHQFPSLVSIEGIRIKGLMAMPPLASVPEDSRTWFASLKKLQNILKNNCDLNRHPMDELSMGTSGDWKVAIAEGATIVRIGTILFGERPTKD